MASSSRRTWIIVLIIVAAVAAGLVAWLLASGGGVTVPDVTGKSEADATALLQGVGLAVGEVTQAADDAVAAGLVVGQDPAAGTEADEGSVVALTLSAGPGTVEVPDVVGMAVVDAEAALKSAGFVPKSALGYDAEIPKDQVMGQLPTAGEQAYKGSTVGLLVSQGPAEDVEVPDVIGMTLDEATDTLADASLQAVPVDEYDSEVPEGTVADQDPPAGKLVAALSEVLIVVSLGQGTTTVTVPDVVGEEERDAVETLEKAGLGATVAEAFSPEVEKGVVMGQKPAAGAKAEEGGDVGVLVSLGPVPSPKPTSTPEPTSTPTGTATPTSTPKPTPTFSAPPGVPSVKVPDVVGLTSEEATAKVKDAVLRPVLLSAPSETVAKDIVIAQLPQAGTKVPQTYPVLILVSTGPPVQVNPLPAEE